MWIDDGEVNIIFCSRLHRSLHAFVWSRFVQQTRVTICVTVTKRKSQFLWQPPITTAPEQQNSCLLRGVFIHLVPLSHTNGWYLMLSIKKTEEEERGDCQEEQGYALIESSQLNAHGGVGRRLLTFGKTINLDPMATSGQISCGQGSAARFLPRCKFWIALLQIVWRNLSYTCSNFYLMLLPGQCNMPLFLPSKQPFRFLRSLETPSRASSELYE